MHTRGGERDPGIIPKAFLRQSLVMGTIVDGVPGDVSFVFGTCGPVAQREGTVSWQEKTLKALRGPWYISSLLPEENPHSTGPS